MFRIIVFTLFFSLLSMSLLFAQSKYANLKVDNLSESEFVQLVTEAEKRGMSDEQLLKTMGANGASQIEQDKLRKRLANYRKNNIQSKSSEDNYTRNWDNDSEFLEENTSIENKDKTNRDNRERNNIDDDSEDKIFGSDLFRNNNIRFEPDLNIVTPANYVIGAGDQLLLDLTGDNEASYRANVSREGTIRLEYVGIIPVAGLTIEAVKSKIANQMQAVYPSIRSGNTKVNLTLGNIRSIKVTITGNSTKPGTYTLPSVANVYHALYASGGPSKNGSYRGIQLIRNNKVIETIDTYDFLTKGIQSGNVRIEDQDVIHIPVYKDRVSVEGKVKNSAVFEVVPGESLKDVLEFAGNFEKEAYTAKVKVLRFTDRERSVADISSENYDKYFPKDGDQYIVEETLDRYANRVIINGAVFRPGQYELTPDLSLLQLIKKADGLKEDAFMGRAYITRLKGNNRQELISFNLEKLISGEEEDYMLKREDRIIISSIFDLEDEYMVSINGEVRYPGEFKYVESMTLGKLIQLSGGLADAANIEQIEIARRIRSNINERDSILSQLYVVNFDEREDALSSDFVLQPFDMISVRSSAGYQYQRQVRIEGEVLYPGVYTISSKNEKISDLVKRAGGLTEYAYLEGASLQRKSSDKKIMQNHSSTSLEKDPNKYESIQDEQGKLLNSTLQKVDGSGSSDTLQFFNYVGIDLDKILNDKNQREDLILEDEDLIVIPKQLQTVSVRGQVLNPNRIVYRPGKSLSYYIDQAGGFTSKAHKKKAFVQYANGSVRGTRTFYPPIKPGSEIVVPTKPEREKMNAQGWVGLGTGVASLAAIIVSLLR